MWKKSGERAQQRKIDDKFIVIFGDWISFSSSSSAYAFDISFTENKIWQSEWEW